MRSAPRIPEIDRRQFLMGAACAATTVIAGTHAPHTVSGTLTFNDNLANDSHAEWRHLVLPHVEWEQRWVSLEAINRGDWANIEYHVTAINNHEKMLLISYRKGQSLQRSRPISGLHPCGSGRGVSNHADARLISQRYQRA